MTRYGRFLLEDGGVRYCRVDGEVLHELDGAPWAAGVETGVRRSLLSSRRLCPVTPSKILCIGRNYHGHVREMGAELPKHPLLFLKPASSLLEPDGTVLLPPESERVEHEAELGVVIGRRGRRVPVQAALDLVFGYTIVGDITARDLQKSDGQWSRAKGFDTFCPTGPEVVAGIDPGALAITARVNGQVRQQGNTGEMLFGVAQLVSHLSQAMTLEPGDLIATGTPEGVGPLADGDRFEIEIDGLGVLAVAVRRERPG
jgi:2-keto-4-pentenoate hydratase/2-oxohepta-3-ene-1,7-dioic acid hydratase in catechol pathway